MLASTSARSIPAILTIAISFLAVTAEAASHQSPSGLSRRHRPPPSRSESPVLNRRGSDSTNATFTSLWYASSYTNGAQPPEYMSGDTAGQTVVIGGSNGTDNNSPVSSCPVAFIGGCAVGGTDETGWQSKAQVVDFDLVDFPLDDGAVLPYYVERKDLTKIKRMVIIIQGAPRDTWRYANLMRYTGLCAVSNPNYDVNFEDYAVAAPLFWNTDDLSAGGASSNQVLWSGSQWATGSVTKNPEDSTYTSFKIMDELVTSLFNQTAYPALTSVVIGGHSAGGLFTQRYAMLRENRKGEDTNMKWWVGNAGSYVWPVDARPVENPSSASSCKSDNSSCTVDAACDAIRNEWPYGIDANDSSTMNVYARSRFENGEKDEILKAYLERRFLYTVGQDDEGPGDTHCQAQYEGDSHLTRGENLWAALASLNAPGYHTAVVPNATHVDEEIYIDPSTQEWFFVDGLNDARNASTGSTSSATDSGDSTSSTSGSQSDSSSSSTGASSSGSSSSAGSNVALNSGLAVLGVLLSTLVGTLFAFTG